MGTIAGISHGCGLGCACPLAASGLGRLDRAAQDLGKLERPLGAHPLNLAVRFLLEVAALLSMGIWGWRYGEGWVRLVLAALIPIAAAALWGTFSVPVLGRLLTPGS